TRRSSDLKFVGIFKENIDKLKLSVQQQQDQIINGDQGLLNHIAQTEKNYSEIIKDAGKFASACQKNYDQYVKNIERTRHQQQKELQELGEKGAEFCARWSSYAKHPYAACQSDFQDLGKIAAKVDPRAVADFQSLSEYCAGQNMGGGNTQNDAYSICESYKDKLEDHAQAYCTDLDKFANCKEEIDDGKGNTRVVDHCETLQKRIVANFNKIQKANHSDGSVSNTYCTANNGSQNSNKTLNFMNSLARELGVQSAGTLRQ